MQTLQILFRAQKQVGNSWAKISKLLSGRSDNSIKNRYYSLTRQAGSSNRANYLQKILAKIGEVPTIRAPSGPALLRPGITAPSGPAVLRPGHAAPSGPSVLRPGGKVGATSIFQQGEPVLQQQHQQPVLQMLLQQQEAQSIPADAAAGSCSQWRCPQLALSHES